jgi:hypothetical protein
LALRKGFKNIMNCPGVRESGYPVLIGPLLNLAHFTKGAKPLYSLVSAIRGLESSDKRDRIFALVGLSSDPDLSLINYNLEIQDVLIPIVTKIICERLDGDDPSTALEILCSASPTSSIENLPSWLPYFDLPIGFCAMEAIFPMEHPLNTVPQISFGKHNVSTEPAGYAMCVSTLA